MELVYNSGGEQVEDTIDPGSMLVQYEEGMAEDGIIVVDEHQLKSKIAHQCDICNKTFVSFKGKYRYLYSSTDTDITDLIRKYR